MIFQQLILQGFKSFKEETIFDFPNDPGLYFIAGKNEVEPKLEANGSGKSTLLDSIVWCFYNKTSRKLKAGDIEPWNDSKNKTFVSIKFKIDENTYILQRFRKPNMLKISENGKDFKTIEQENLENLIKLTYDEFLFSVVFGQFCEMFFDKKSAESMELLTTVLNLEKWDIFSLKCKAKTDEIELILTELYNKLAKNEGSFSILQDLDLDEKIQDFEKNKQEEIKNLEISIEDHQNHLKNISQKAKVLLKTFEEINSDLSKYDSEYDEISRFIKEIERELSENSSQIKYKDNEIRKITQEYNRIDSLGAVCDECGQKIDDSFKSGQLESLDLEKIKIKQSIKDLKDLSEQLSEELKEVIHAKKEFDLELKDLMENKSKISSEINYLKYETVQKQNEFKRLQSQLENLKIKRNPYAEDKQKNEKLFTALTSAINDLKSKIGLLETKRDGYKFWTKSFKDIRLMIVSDVISQLEFEVNDALFHLGLKDWKIEFSIDKETKSGSTQRKFTVLIYSPYNDKAVPWECWSGGESQRLRLSGTYGLSNLICSRKGVFPNVEFYDEPSSGLNQNGINDLMDSLKARALDTGKCIFIIDHRYLENSMFADSFCVVKDDNGSRIEKLTQ